MCGLSPREVDEMGWFDLAQFTIQVDDENDETRRRLRQMQQPGGAPALQQMTTRL